ncbi:MAG: alpha/beta hydrolase [Bacteroidia bacterium]
MSKFGFGLKVCYVYRMKFGLKDGHSIYYEDSENKHANYSLIFLNGLSQSTLSWSAIAPSFKNSRVILVDLLFQGKSDAPQNFRSYNDHAEDVAALIQHLRLKNTIVCGISYGSAVAQHLLVHHSNLLSGGILMSTFGHNTPLFNAIGESWKSALIAGGYPLMLDVMLPVVLGKSYFENPFIPIETLKESRVARDLKPENLLKLMQATETRGDFRSHLKHINKPVLVVHGAEDLLIPVATAKEVADNIPGAEFRVISDAGHTLNLEAIPQVIQLIKEFLEKNTERKK